MYIDIILNSLMDIAYCNIHRLRKSFRNKIEFEEKCEPINC